MGGWQTQKELPSLTGGRGLDFLSRKDVPEVAQPGKSPANEANVTLPPINMNLQSSSR